MRAAILTLAVMLAGTPALAAPKACASAGHRQFDFWVGRWDVYAAPKPDKLVAHSLIESLYDGCAVRENWMPLKGNPGGSLNAYEAGAKVWRQFWADSQGGSALFSGTWTGKAMVLTGVWPQPGHPQQMTRMTYTRRADGTVEQLGVTSDDHGKTWQPSFDFLYRRAAR